MLGAATCRNREILWFTQILWEVIEIITCYFIPNFGECWWDSIILDIFLCNGLGIEIGLIIADYFNFVRWEWCWLWSWPNVKYKTLKFIGLSAQRPVFKLGDLDENGYEIYGCKNRKTYKYPRSKIISIIQNHMARMEMEMEMEKEDILSHTNWWRNIFGHYLVFHVN